MAGYPCPPPFGPLLRNVKKRSRRFFMAGYPCPPPFGPLLRNVKKRSRRFFTTGFAKLYFPRSIFIRVIYNQVSKKKRCFIFEIIYENDYPTFSCLVAGGVIVQYLAYGQ
ncbi:MULTISPECIES: hypothetical protein [unclassified Brenneria]|uniref:hypothetical protein n=1 Tax=unclassified Brenneria TaxID=2634434 RepID=UPI0015554659|nr:hypothetical protein [Brenneria sp. hezel4-2-4]MEE3651757.1 hypothetical protein [Brenneria sp. HEZEL_4_2_4]NPD01713.1 hypothetical protein [Brenneria sp. hezel4-2-4]